ncbi:MAG: prenyltransferase [Candidatus Thiodiazotropha sp.]
MPVLTANLSWRLQEGLRIRPVLRYDHMNKKYTFLGALRPFSLVVAVATCGLGVSLALIDNAQDAWLAWLVLFTGLLLQIAVNLVNDAPDLANPDLDRLSRENIRRNHKLGWMIMLLAIILGLYMVSIRGWPLFLLGLAGVAGAWGYTGGKVNYKQRGLGIVLVFLLMGVLLIGGSYYVLSGLYTWKVFWLSLPFSLLSSLLLLSNELRDYESDREAGIETGIQNGGTAILVTGTILNNPTMTIAPVMYGILMLIPTFTYTAWLNRG